jgi:hypothetical protein
MYEGCSSLGSVPGTEMICVSSEGGDLVGNSVLRDSWRYNGVVVPVSIERWWPAILHTAVDILVRKHLSGNDVGFVGYKKEAVLALYGWMESFGREHDVYWFDESVDQDGMPFGRVVTFGMFAWAVRCGVVSEEDLRDAEGSLGGLLALAVSMCHCPGLVDADVLSFVRCVVIVLYVAFVVVLYVSCWVCCFIVLTVTRFGSCAGG